MKGLGFSFVVVLLIGTAGFSYLSYSGNGSAALNTGTVPTGNKSAITSTMKRRKLKGNTDTPNEDENKARVVTLEDYRPIDPVPSSTVSIKHGPIQHGTPMMPYIPEPSPPPQQVKHDEFP